MMKTFLMLFVLVTAFTARALTLDEAMAQSHVWPPYVNLTEAYYELPEAERPSLQKGMRLTLIRVEDGELLVDTGRDGLHRIDPAITDFLTEARAYHSGEKQKFRPNVTALVGDKLMEFLPNGDPERIEEPRFRYREYILFLYLDSNSITNPQRLAELTELKSMLMDDGAGYIAIFPLRYDFYREVGRQIPEWPIIMQHLLLGYGRALAHVTEPGEELLVLSDSNGKLLHRTQDIAEMKQVLSTVLAEDASHGPAHWRPTSGVHGG